MAKLKAGVYGFPVEATCVEHNDFISYRDSDKIKKPKKTSLINDPETGKCVICLNDDGRLAISEEYSGDQAAAYMIDIINGISLKDNRRCKEALIYAFTIIRNMEKNKPTSRYILEKFNVLAGEVFGTNEEVF